MITRQDIIDEARKWAGVPFRHQGRSARGIDCIGLVLVTAQALKLTTVDVKNYRRTAAGRNFSELFAEHMDPVSLGDIRDSDVMLFKFGAFECHCAIVTDSARGRIIHAYQPYGKTVEEYLSEDSALYVCRTKAFRFRGVD